MKKPIVDLDIPIKVFEIVIPDEDSSKLFDSARRQDKFIGTFLSETNAEKYCKEHNLNPTYCIESRTELFHPEYPFMDKDQFDIRH